MLHTVPFGLALASGLSAAGSQASPDKKKAQINRGSQADAIKARLQRFNSDTPEHPFRHVYVGNLGPNVTEDAIKEHLKPCGPVLSVQICCVGGSVLANSKSAVPSKRYATVIFLEPVAVPRAVDFYKRFKAGWAQLDGSLSLVCDPFQQFPDDLSLKVAAFLWKLPEMRAILDAQSLNPIRNLQPVPRPLRAERTLRMLTEDTIEDECLRTSAIYADMAGTPTIS